MHPYMLYIVVKFQAPSSNSFRDMNFFLGQVTPRRQTESDVYEPTVLLHKWAQKVSQDRPCVNLT